MARLGGIGTCLSISGSCRFASLLIQQQKFHDYKCKESFTYLADVVRTWLELDTEKKENKTESIEEIQAKEPPATKRIDDINDELWLPKF